MPKTFLYDMITTNRLTYRYLRWVMVAALVALFLSVLIQSVKAGCWLGSVSAYYYTPARTVFVGSLIAFGAALIAYKGRAPEEDVALNFSGYLAIVVAMVPTVEDDMCPASGFGQSKEEIGRAVVNNVWSLVVTTAIAAVVLLWRWRSDRKAVVRNAPVDAERRKSYIRARILSVVCIGVLVGEFCYFLVNPELFIERSHGIAAITMVAGLVGVMLFSAWFVPHNGSVLRLSFRVWYNALALILAVLVVAVRLAQYDHLTLILELVVFAVFVAYWILQSIELWGRSTDGKPSGPAGQAAKSAGDRPQGPPPAGAEATEHAGPVPVFEEATE